MSLVDLALERAPAEREAYLRTACEHDSQLFDEVRKYVDAEERMNGFLLDPLYPSPSFELRLEPGELLDGRFRIVREVAQGGMGIVYEAQDEKLDRRIAVKCAKAGFRKRLPPEARHATEISHPNVCKIFEIHTAATDHGEVDFLTMEFLDGETLAERLRRGRLSESEARTIAQQLSAGLAAAHRNQVIHGDLKSGNVILTKAADGSTRAVITDFGLARRPETTQQTIRSGAMGGTPDYMAPELWKGEKATVASDIYALGVILYELASGHTPFASSSEMTWEERLSARPPAVHPKWDRVLARCLEADPAHRFHTAQEVEQALAPPRSRRWVVAAAAAVVLAAITGVITYERATAPPETVRLALLPLETDRDTAPLADRLLQETAAQISRLKGSARTAFRLIDPIKTQRNQVRTVDQARASVGASHVLHGTLRKENDKLKLYVQLTNASTGGEARQWDAEYAPSETRYIPVALAGIVTETLHLPPLVAAPTVNAAALADFQKGMEVVRNDDKVDDALAFFSRAATADPHSSVAYAELAEAQWKKYYFTQDKIWLDRMVESLEEAEVRNPDVAQVHRMNGRVLDNSGRYDQAAAEYLRAIELEPGNSDTYRRLGWSYEENKQPNDALAAYQQAVALDPASSVNHLQLGGFYQMRSDYATAAREDEQAARLAPGSAEVHFSLGTIYEYQGRFAQAERELLLSIHQKDSENAEKVLGQAYLYQRREREALGSLSRAADLAPSDFVPWYFLGVAYRRINRPRESLQANNRALTLAEEQLAGNPRDGRTRAFVAYLSATLGDRRRAESDAAQALQTSPEDVDARWMTALTYETLNRRERTLDVLKLAGEQMLADLNRWPDAENLQRDPRFIQLLASHQTNPGSTSH